MEGTMCDCVPSTRLSKRVAVIERFPTPAAACTHVYVHKFIAHHLFITYIKDETIDFRSAKHIIFRSEMHFEAQGKATTKHITEWQRN